MKKNYNKQKRIKNHKNRKATQKNGEENEMR